MSEYADIVRRFAALYLMPPGSDIHCAGIRKIDDEIVLHVIGESQEALGALPPTFEGLAVHTKVGPHGRVL